MGDLSDEDMNCRMFARDLGAVCVNVEYRYFTSSSFDLADISQLHITSQVPNLVESP